MNAGPQYQRSKLKVEPGFSPTPLLGLIEAGTGLVLLFCAPCRTRASKLFVGVLVLIAGIMVVAAPDAFADSLATERSYGVALIILGGLVAFRSLVVPDRSSRLVTYR